MGEARDDDGRSGKVFVVGAVILACAFVVFLLLVTPALQDQLGIGAAEVALPTPSEPQRVPLVDDGTWEGTVVWDAAGLCAEVRDAAQTTTRACAAADPLRPFWGIHAAAGDPNLVVTATAPDVAVVEAVTADGAYIRAPAQRPHDALPGGFAVLVLPPGAQVQALLALDEAGGELVRAPCGSGEQGPQLLGGGCTVPAE